MPDRNPSLWCPTMLARFETEWEAVAVARAMSVSDGLGQWDGRPCNSRSFGACVLGACNTNSPRLSRVQTVHQRSTAKNALTYPDESSEHEAAAHVTVRVVRPHVTSRARVRRVRRVWRKGSPGSDSSGGGECLGCSGGGDTGVEGCLVETRRVVPLATIGDGRGVHRLESWLWLGVVCVLNGSVSQYEGFIYVRGGSGDRSSVRHGHSWRLRALGALIRWTVGRSRSRTVDDGSAGTGQEWRSIKSPSSRLSPMAASSLTMRPSQLQKVRAATARRLTARRASTLPSTIACRTFGSSRARRKDEPGNPDDIPRVSSLLGGSFPSAFASSSSQASSASHSQSLYHAKHWINAQMEERGYDPGGTLEWPVAWGDCDMFQCVDQGSRLGARS